MENNIPVSEKILLTAQEASQLTHIGINRMRRMLREKDCPFALYVGGHCLVKRSELEKYLQKAYSV